ncbi:hypothetical protein [Segetibacter sp. 3557_3]|uniref:hypothetical protein n=1 Tax=Segetibacter sp. 3557_3 TaxID=2547429 RepID=UPI001404A3A5|nr:hypothetical protein [Segetibacter sp. 3557_3]
MIPSPLKVLHRFSVTVIWFGKDAGCTAVERSVARPNGAAGRASKVARPTTAGYK